MHRTLAQSRHHHDPPRPVAGPPAVPGAGALLALQRAAGNGAVAGALSVQRSATAAEVAQQYVMDTAVAQQRLLHAWQLIQAVLGAGRGEEEGRYMQTSLQRAATVTGALNSAAAKPNAGAAPGMTATVNWANVRAVSNTSTAMDSEDLHDEQTGAGVGATRPTDWWTFVAMVGGNTPFVQGHTLHQDLGGDGNHDNLSPFTHSSNGLHFHRVEAYVLDQTELANQGEYAHYDVDLSYGGNAGIGAWAVGRFNAMGVPMATAAMVQAGLLTLPQAAGHVAAGAIPAADIAVAHQWLTDYADDTFPSDFDCTVWFKDDVGGGNYAVSNAQQVNITNDI